MRRGLLGMLAIGAATCGTPGPAEPPLRVWHTFGPEETAALNAALPAGVAATLLPFGRAENRIRDTLARGGEECPDLVRIDATWLPGLAAQLRPAPALDGFLPEARELAEWQGTAYGLPQAIDGLALLYDAARLRGLRAAWPPRTLDELVAAARELGGRALSLRADGYWFVAWLRASGGDVLDPATGALGIDRPEAEAALARYGALVAEVAPAPELAGDEARREAARFASGEVAIVVGGPWTVAALAASGRELAVAPYPRAPGGAAAAPRGGHVWVVPRCAGRPDDAWALAERLTAPGLQARWSRELGLVPTRIAALAEASPLARAFAAALPATRPLPRDALTPALFDDLTPAVEAVLAGDATPAEALAGVAHGWRRLLARRGAR